MELKEVDSYCNRILTILLMEGKELAFNELFKIVRIFEFKFSRPTLTDHLNNYLVKSGLVEKRIDKRSKLYLKPCYYSINEKVLSKLFPISEQTNKPLEEFKKIDASLKNNEFKETAEKLLRLVYIGDLINIKLFFKSMVSENPTDKRMTYLSTRLGTAYMDAIRIKLLRLSKKVKEKEIEEVITEFDKQIDIVTRFFKTGKLE